MDAENGQLWAQLFGKKKIPKKREGGLGAQHMMSTEMMEALAKADWEDHIATVHHEAAAQFKAIKSAIKEQDKAEEEEKQCTEWDAQAAAKPAVWDALKAKKAAFTLAVKCIGQAQRDGKRDLASAEKTKAVALKKVATEAKCAAAAEKRFQKEQEQIAAMDGKAEKAQQRAAEATARREKQSGDNKGRARTGTHIVEDETMEITPPVEITPPIEITPPVEIIPPIEITPIQLQPSLPKPWPWPLAKQGAFLPALDAESVPECDRQGGTDVRTGKDDLFIINWRSKCLATRKEWSLLHARLGIASYWSSSHTWGQKHLYLTLCFEIFIKNEILTRILQKYIFYAHNML